MNVSTPLRRNRCRGFTLVELVIVLTIIALLAGSAIYLVVGVVDDAKYERVRGDINSLEVALQSYVRNNNFRPPTQEQGLNALMEKPTSEPIPVRWRPYLTEKVLDPWGQEYRYRFPATRSNKDYDLYSIGEDGVEDSEDDIGNWGAASAEES